MSELSYSDRLLGGQTVNPANPSAVRRLGGGVIDDPSRAAGYGTQAIGSLPTDETQRVRFFASRRFPNMPTTKAMERYGYRDGRLFYLDDDGKAFYEESDFEPPTSLENINSTGKAMMGGVGPAMPVVAGTAAGVMTTPILGGVPFAGLGGAAGDVTRQFAANRLAGEKDRPWSDRAMQTGGAALSEAVGQGLGALGARTMNRFGRTPSYDIPTSNQVMQDARQLGVSLTPGEATGNRALIRRQKVLQNTTEADEIFENFYNIRNEQVRNASLKWMQQIAPGDEGARVYAAQGREGAEAAVGAARKEMQAQAAPYYERALLPDNLIPAQTVGSVNGVAISAKEAFEDPLVASLVKRARSDQDYGPSLGDLPNTSMVVVDRTKKYIDGQISAARQAGDRERVNLLQGAKEKLLAVADKAYPDYKYARSIYEDGMPGATAIEKGLVGKAARVSEAEELSAPRVIFGRNSSPAAVRQARQAFSKAGKEQEWNALVRSYIEQTLDEIPESSTGAVVNLGGSFRKSLMGNGRKMGMLKEALADNPEALKTLTQMSNTLAATGKAMKGESITAFAQQGQKELAREGMGWGPRIIETAAVWNTPQRIAAYWADLNAGKYNKRMAELLTTEDGLKQLAELRQLSSTSRGAVIGLSHLLLSGVESIATPPPFDREPSTTQQGPWSEKLGLE